MSSSNSKVFVKIDTINEQQEILKNTRKGLKVLQKSTDKENLVGRTSNLSKGIFIKSKSETEINDSEGIKRKKVATHACQTDLERQTLSQITEEDLTTADEPSEGYWKALAEQRRVALDSSLKENEELHDRINNLEEELNISRTMLEETQNLVEVLTELVQEQHNTNDTKHEASINSLMHSSLVEELIERNETKDDIVTANNHSED